MSLTRPSFVRGYGPRMTNPQPGYGPPEDTVLSILAHLSLFAFGLIGPLVLYLITKDDSSKPMTRHHAAEALNFHLSLAIYAVVSAILIIVIVGFFMLLGLAVAATVLAITAAVAASRREAYRYPLTIRFVH
ncbi:MAG: hypothetical protein JWO12_1837 [Frankiales bacterium]|nr:hypothetical protein [Frankiales bacterium]